MTDAYCGQIELFAFGIVPRGWFPCDGRTLQMSQFQGLFALIGTTYGGDGRNTFQLPDLRGRIAVGAGRTYNMGQVAGEEGHALTLQEVPARPAHSHQINAFDGGTSPSPGPTPSSTTALAQTTGIAPQGGSFTVQLYGAPTSMVNMASQTIRSAGGAAHENRMPFVALNYCINYAGPFPP